MTETPNPILWIGPVLCCAASDPGAYEGICGLPIESEPCPVHGTYAEQWEDEDA